MRHGKTVIGSDLETAHITNHGRLLILYRLLIILATALLSRSQVTAQTPAVADPASGLQLAVAEGMTCPTLRLLLPTDKGAQGSALIPYPEHVTVLEHGRTEVKHLYLWQPGHVCERLAWRKKGRSLEYEMDLEDNVHMLARATLESDGVIFHIELSNRSDVNYDKVEPIWDPRFKESFFKDVRLERTYVHRQGGFELIASDLPDRLTMPLDQWLPNRYLNSHTWPVPPPNRRAVKDGDGITYYNASRPVDQPLIATLSEDKKWVAASYTKDPGNVWTNPELTCQHANALGPLRSRGKVTLEGKTFVFRGTLDQLLKKITP